MAHALNVNVVVTLDEVTAGKAMSFSSLNGKIDVTLPRATKAKLIMKSDMGEIFSDFDVQMDSSSRQAQVEDGRGKGGKCRMHIDKTVYGLINGGGPDFQFKTFNGNIYIRSK